MNTKLKTIIVSLITLFILCAMPAYAEKEIIPGVTYLNFTRSWSARRPVRVHVIRVDMTKGVEVKAALAKNAVGRLLRTSAITYRNGGVAGVNGTFFDKSWPYLPIGLIVIDGKILMKSLLNRSAIGISRKNGIKFGVPKFTGNVINNATKDKIPIMGMNRPRKEGDVIIYTPEYGWTTKTNTSGVELIIEDNMVVGLSDGNSPIPRKGYVLSFHGWTKNYTNALPPGANVTANYRLTEGWDQYEQVITGGPRILKDGENVVLESVEKENFSSEVFGRNARTAIGVDSKGRIYLVVVEGRRGYRRSRGVRYIELAEAMKDLGIKDAIGLDGGGSSTMYVDGSVVNALPGGYQQGVSNAVIVKPYYREEEISVPQTQQTTQDAL